VALAVLAVCLLGAGCGGGPSPPDYGSEDGKQIARLVEELNEATSDEKRFRQAFAGPAPKDRKHFNAHLFDVDGAPAVTGDSATARVKVRSDGEGKDRGTQEWTFVKEGGQWKIKSAPLP
jgi:hypothetical protein